MTRSHLWKFLFVLLTIALSIGSIVPIRPRNLINQFEQAATEGDTNTVKILEGIVTKARELDAKNPSQSYSNLLVAIDNNDITQFFPKNYVDLSQSANPTRTILNRLQRDASSKFRLGIDLQGGTSFQLELDPSKGGQKTNDTFASGLNSQQLVDQAMGVLRKRVDALGVSEPIIQAAGENRLLVQLPGLSDAAKEDARRLITKAAYLEFRLVHPKSDELQASGLIPPGYTVLTERRLDKTTLETRNIPYVVTEGPERGLDGQYLETAQVSLDPTTGKPEVNFAVKGDGITLLREITTANIGRQLAIILDGELISAPVIQSAMPNGSGRITGNYSMKEAQELASTLENPLAAPLRIMSESSITSSLGTEAVNAGLKACVWAVAAVAVFMLIYYMFAGAVANVALLLNILLLLGVMCSLNVTYTLPGIAGIVLTVGMAVDANVLIFERMREEGALGKSLRGTISAGYDKAFGTILDANITTLISSVLLIALGTGTVKGFGVALTIGLIVSMFTSLVVTRLIFDVLVAKGILKSLPMLHMIRGAHLDFMGLAKPAFALSWALILIGIGYGLFGRGKEMLGVEFAGGDSLTFSLNSAGKPSDGDVRKVVDDLKLGESIVRYQTEASGRESLSIIVPHDDSVPAGQPGNGEKAESALMKAFPNAQFVRTSLEAVGPSVGIEIQKSAIIATMLSLFGILVYVAFRYEFSFAVAAVIAVVHDVLMTIGWYCLTGVTGHGRQFNATFVAAILTIIGFSINDTIVIFDRIREDLKLGKPGNFKEVLNRALNETLSRTVITSGTVFMASVILYFFGGVGINDFAFTFIVGIVTGTYSSIYIASALVFWWSKGQRPSIGSAVNPGNPVMDPTVVKNATA